MFNVMLSSMSQSLTLIVIATSRRDVVLGFVNACDEFSEVHFEHFSSEMYSERAHLNHNLGGGVNSMRSTVVFDVQPLGANSY